MPDHTVIHRRFRGPAASGNGGCSCGLIAREIAGVSDGAVKAGSGVPDENGDIRTEIICAALDCSSYFGLQKPG